MTICIGALSADQEGRPSGAAVVASDRMVTLFRLIEFEHEIPKTIPTANRVVTLVSGDALRGSRLVRETAASLPAGPVSVDAVAATMVARYVDLRRRQIEAEIFAPRGITLEQFYNVLQQRLLPQIAGSIDRQVVDYDYGVELLLAGVDDGGGHLYTISNPGFSRDFAPISFAAIGSGALHAFQSMIGFRHTGAQPLRETVFSVYASKRRAEVAPGVGRDTDLTVVLGSGIRPVAPPVLAQLAELYEEYQRPVTEELRAKVAQLNLFGEGA